ncbi:MAG: cellulase family glycosylhydrolase [Lentisphaeria bacterium]|nr:cellulase family glycosylhydrolase [Lentisphaeria bacterium]
MKLKLIAVIQAAFVAALAASASETLVWKLDFSEPAVRKIVEANPNASLRQEKDGTWVLNVTAPKADSSGALRFPLDAAALGLGGSQFRFEAGISYRGVSRPAGSWNGVKFMAPFTAGKLKTYPQWSGFPDAPRWGSHPLGTATWRYRFREGARDAYLTLGLEDAAGSAEFRNVKLFRTDQPVSTLSLSPVPQARYTAGMPPRGRGMMSPIISSAGEVKEEDFRVLKAWNANLLRWQIALPWRLRSGSGGKEYAEYVKSQYPVLDRVFALAEKYGIWIVVDLHLHEPSFCLQTGEGRDRLHEIWRGLAAHCRGKAMLWGYDLLNEPSTASANPELEPIAALYDSLIRTVRAADPETPVIVASDNGGSLDHLEYLPVYPYDNIIYTIHFYRPNALTHQLDRKAAPHMGYPDREKGWDKAYLRRQLERVRKFQLATGARIYVGEFSIIRWAPGGEEYLRDATSLFEEYGWDWSYHAFREWDGWSLEHGDDPANAAPAESGRRRAMLKALRKNVTASSRAASAADGGGGTR